MTLPGVMSAEEYKARIDARDAKQQLFENSMVLIGLIVDGTDQPLFGVDAYPSHGVCEYVDWWSDGEDSRWTN